MEFHSHCASSDEKIHKKNGKFLCRKHASPIAFTHRFCQRTAPKTQPEKATARAERIGHGLSLSQAHGLPRPCKLLAVACHGLRQTALAKLAKRLTLNLAHALAANLEVRAQLLQRVCLATAQTVAQANDFALALR